jgi:hypothetical protein
MDLLRRVKTAMGWGFFFGIVLWLLTTGISNDMPFTSKGVWSIIMTQTLLGLVIAIVSWNILWWVRGILFGIAINLPLAYYSVYWNEFGWCPGFLLFIIIGAILGISIELALKQKYSTHKET